jgi:hypothetical protein
MLANTPILTDKLTKETLKILWAEPQHIMRWLLPMEEGSLVGI